MASRYRIYFRDDQGLIATCEDFTADNDVAARRVAAALFAACSDCCASFDLHAGKTRIDSDEVGEPRAGLGHKMQEAVIEVEERLLRSRSQIARSERLIGRLEAIHRQRPPRASATARKQAIWRSLLSWRKTT